MDKSYSSLKNADRLLREYWYILSFQKIFGLGAFEYMEQLFIDVICEKYNIQNDNAEMYNLLEKMHKESPNDPPSFGELLEKCVKEQLIPSICEEE